MTLRTGYQEGFARPADKHTDLVAALSRVLRARLIAERDQVLDEIDTSQSRWSSQLSIRLDQVDESLISLGHFDVAEAP